MCMTLISSILTVALGAGLCTHSLDKDADSERSGGLTKVTQLADRVMGTEFRLRLT